jgi:hypothetical protein
MPARLHWGFLGPITLDSRLGDDREKRTNGSRASTMVAEREDVHNGGRARREPGAEGPEAVPDLERMSHGSGVCPMDVGAQMDTKDQTEWVKDQLVAASGFYRVGYGHGWLYRKIA